MFYGITKCYEQFRLISYRSLFRLLRERDGSLSATEAFAVDVIYLLRGPTLKEFADCIGISQPNATYKVNNLIKKGYIERTPSETDRREAHLHVTDKFRRYCAECNSTLARACRALRDRFSPEEIGTFSRMLETLSDTIDRELLGREPRNQED